MATNPVTSPTSLPGAGTFGQAISPPLNTPVTVAASGSVSIPETAEGYISANVIDSISGAGICGVGIIITDEDRASGAKVFNISAGAFFAQAANLQVAVSTRQLDGANATSAPTISGASLSSFSASAQTSVSKVTA